MSKMLYRDNTSEEKKAARRAIRKIESRMEAAWDPKYLEELHEQALDIWWDNFPFEVDQLGSNLSTTKLYHTLLDKLRNNASVTINVFGCNVTINTATS